MAHVGRALPQLAARGVPPRFFGQCAAAYTALTLAAVVITRTELRLPLVHYRSQRIQVPASLSGRPLKRQVESRNGRGAAVMIVC